MSMPAVSLRRLGGTWFVALAASLLAPAGAQATQEYRYIEAEEYASTEASGLREEGFTTWMRHPSHGKVMVMFGKGFLEYRVKGLGPGPYHVFVRGLSWASGADVDVLWDGQKLGRASYEVPGTALKWSSEVGTVQGPGDHVLRLANEPSNTQAPYLDAVLLTTQAGYRPPEDDADFTSFTTPLPLLFVPAPKGESGILPEPKCQVDTAAPEVAGARAVTLGIGRNEVRVELRNTVATERRVEVSVRLGNGDEGTASVALPAGGSASVAVPADAVSPGKAPLSLRLREQGRALLAGTYQVTIPDPVRISLGESACPLGTDHVTWRAAFTTRPEVTREVGIGLALVRASDGRVLQQRKLVPAGDGAESALALAALPAGRYLVRASLRRGDRLMVRDEREFFVYQPTAAETWEPVKRTEARGDAVFVNGKPFLPRLLYHAGIDENTRGHGFNLVQCYGSDPDPRASIQNHLDACAKVGLWGAVALFNNRYFLAGDHFDLEHLKEAVLRFKTHPALFCWDLVDEPDGAGVPPERVAEAARLIRQLDPDHLVWVNLCQPDRGADYLESQDVWSFDAYPFPTQGLAGYLPWLKVGDEKVRGTRPLGTCLQTYCYPGSRMPTPDELRSSYILHVIHGYKWFGCYSYFDGEPSGCLARDPALWSYTRALNAEMYALAPVLLDPAPIVGIRVDATPERFQAASKRIGGVTTLFAVNLSSEPITVRLPVAGKSAKVLFEEARTIAIRNGVVEDTFAPGRSRVYQVR